MPFPCAVELCDVSKLYGSFAALRKLSAEFHSAQCYVILGQNGAGKSTLLRVIAGLIRPTYGSQTILGSSDPSVIRSRVGYLGHDSMLYDELTAVENLRYFASLYPGSHTSIMAPVEALETVG
ncbi:MAG: ATP-binding cassette domain-containing protein, partial [Acidobacteriaceae bacterium]